MTEKADIRDDGDLAPAERDRLLGRYGRKFAAGETLFREGAAADEAFLLQEGRVRLLKRVRMVERSLMVLKPGDLFGETALLEVGRTPGGTDRAPEGASRNSTAIAMTDGTALALDRQTFKALIANHPSVAARVIEQLVRRLRDAEDQIEIMMLRDTQSKIVSALLKLAVSGPELVVSPVELSTRVGLDVETVKRGVQRLRDQSYVRITGERIEIPDVEALRRLYVLLGTKEELRGDAK